MTAYEKLEKRFRRVHHLKHLEAIAQWDYAVMMPAGGSDSRGSALAELEVMCQEMLSGPEVKDWLDSASAKTGDLSDWQQANLREMHREWGNATSVSADVVEAKALAASKCEHAWRSLRKDNNWKDFLPLFKEVVRLTQEEAQQRAAATSSELYDALLHTYEPNGRSADIDLEFAELKKFLPGFIDQVIEKQKSDIMVKPRGPFPVEKQRELGQELMAALGFNFDHGRLDESHHPFCGGVPHDVRITSRYSADDFTEGLMGVIHETGHACYEQGLPKEWVAQPVGEARGMSIHEGQSLLFEMQLSRSEEFLFFATPFIQKHFRESAHDAAAFSEDNLKLLYTRVHRDYIRVNADEVTYPMHVILRYEIEKELIEGKLKTEDLPEIWDKKMTEYLGLSTKDNYKDGCMQDVHWPGGAFGYFPTYTLGAMTAAQVFAKARVELPELSEQIRNGEFAPMMTWVRNNIWSKASLFETNELLTRATGEKLNPKYFEEHLKSRYLQPS